MNKILIFLKYISNLLFVKYEKQIVTQSKPLKYWSTSL